MVNSSLTFYTPSTTALDAMVAACENAKKSIKIEEFILSDDETGRRFTDIFSQKIKDGCSVKLILDGWGAREFLDTTLHQKLLTEGVEIEIYRPVNWLKPHEILPRDHRKILIVDDNEAYIGGVCLTNKVTSWFDTMVKTEGNLIPQIVHIFEKSWRQFSNSDDDTDSHPHFETEDELSLFANSPDSNRQFFTEKLLEQLNACEQEISIVTPYFTPSKRLVDCLINKAQQGVKVEIILSQKLDKTSPYYVAKELAGTLLKSNIHVYYYQPQVIHLKAMLVDNWAAIGSCNFDGLSIEHNREAMIAGIDKVFYEDVKKLLDNVKMDSKKIDLTDWKKRSFIEKVMGKLLFPFRSYL